METTANLSLWTDAGYDLFAREGPEHIQIERLAGILHVDKSAFYNHFDNLETYYTELLKLHKQRAAVFLEGLKKTKTIDPDFIRLLIEHKVAVMFQTQLTRVKDPVFHTVSEEIHRQEDVLIRQLWSNFLGTENDTSLGLQYFNVIRDIFYGHVTFENFTHAFLQNLLQEAKAAIEQLRESKSREQFLH